MMFVQAKQTYIVSALVQNIYKLLVIYETFKTAIQNFSKFQ